nr:hypothetical protein PsAHV6-049 [Psittacid alphaherpesvirus 6]
MAEKTTFRLYVVRSPHCTEGLASVLIALASLYSKTKLSYVDIFPGVDVLLWRVWEKTGRRVPQINGKKGPSSRRNGPTIIWLSVGAGRWVEG